VESVEALDPTHFRVISRLGLGPFKARFTMEVQLYDIVLAQSARMAIQGKAPGSVIEVRSSMRVDDTVDGQVQLRWAASADVRGSMAGVGRRFLGLIADRLTTHFWADFARRVGERLPSDRQVQILPM
jgi:carbon monoxide dehydrogenase subunit G